MAERRKPEGWPNHPARVRLDQLPNDLVVSTVELDFASPWKQEFESMVFPPGSMRELDSRRYATYEEAVQGHEAMCAEWAGIDWRWSEGEEEQEEWPNLQ